MTAKQGDPSSRGDIPNSSHAVNANTGHQASVRRKGKAIATGTDGHPFRAARSEVPQNEPVIGGTGSQRAAVRRESNSRYPARMHFLKWLELLSSGRLPHQCVSV